MEKTGNQSLLSIMRETYNGEIGKWHVHLINHKTKHYEVFRDYEKMLEFYGEDGCQQAYDACDRLGEEAAHRCVLSALQKCGYASAEKFEAIAECLADECQTTA